MGNKATVQTGTGSSETDAQIKAELVSKAVTKALAQAGIEEKMLPMFYIESEHIHSRCVLGQGGGGEVLKGVFDSSFVALKKTHNLASTGIKCGQSMQEFCSEAEMTLKMSHPNVLRIYGFTVVEDPRSQAGLIDLYMVCELAEGGSLQNIIDKHNESGNRILQNDIAAWTGQQSAALKYLHQHNVLHLDVKPDNILIDINRRTKLCDFGLAATLCPETKDITDRHQLHYSYYDDKAAAKACAECSSQFSMMLTKKHCHLCGRVICANCSEANMSVHGFIAKQHVCTRCIGYHEGGSGYKFQGGGSRVFMPPETLRCREGTIIQNPKKIDVWAFGIVIWMMYAAGTDGGSNPYPDVHPARLFRFLTGGSRARKLQKCPMETLIRKCWAADPADRPSFEAISAHAEKLDLLLRGSHPIGDVPLDVHDESKGADLDLKLYREFQLMADRKGTSDGDPSLGDGTKLEEGDRGMMSLQGAESNRHLIGNSTKEAEQGAGGDLSKPPSPPKDTIEEETEKALPEGYDQMSDAQWEESATGLSAYAGAIYLPKRDPPKHRPMADPKHSGKFLS